MHEVYPIHAAGTDRTLSSSDIAEWILFSAASRLENDARIELSVLAG